MFRIILFSTIIMCSTLAQDGKAVHSLLGKPAEINRRTFNKNFTNIDALRRSVERNPFEIWYFKDRFKTFEDMSLTPETYYHQMIERSTTKERLHNIMIRALRGENIGVTIMGGSISAGGGMINDYPDLRGIYYRVFIDWWQKAVQPFTGSNIGTRNLAIGGTGSNFFSFCYKTLMKPDENLDIVFLEFSVNDFILFKDTHLPRALSLEKLTRQLLNEESFPAVMFVNFIQGKNYVPVCDSLENNGQTMLAWHYGITSLSMRDSLCPNMGMDKRPAMFSSDGNHASIIAHAQMAMMIINSARHALLRAIESSKQDFHLLPLHDLQRPVYFINTQGVVPGPLCYALITPDVTKTFFNPSLSVAELENRGFKQVKDVAIGFHKIIPEKSDFKPLRTDGYGGWEAERKNSTLKLQFDLPLDRNVGYNITRSVDIVFRTSGLGGKAEFWLAKNKPGIIVDSYSPFGHTRVITVAHHVTTGSHVLTVRLVNDGKFLFCGIATSNDRV